jgi:O-succinylhomoserine sulfhydrylase
VTDHPDHPGDGEDHLETIAVTAGREGSGDSLAPVLFPSTTYQVDSLDAHRRDTGRPRSTQYYSRFGSPTVRDFEDLVAELEGAEAALAGASGMATLSSVLLTFCSSGDHVVATRQLF